MFVAKRPHSYLVGALMRGLQTIFALNLIGLQGAKFCFSAFLEIISRIKTKDQVTTFHHQEGQFEEYLNIKY